MLAKLMNWLYPRNARIVWQPPEQWYRNLHGLSPEQRSERSRKSAVTRKAKAREEG